MYRHPLTALANLRRDISGVYTCARVDTYGAQFEASLLGRGPLSRSFFSRVKMHPPAGEVSRRRQPTLPTEPRPRTRAIG